YYAANLGMILALALCAWLWRRRPAPLSLLPLLLGASLALAVNAVFLVEVAAPRLLHLPFHHCPYDLVPQAPEGVLAVALFLLGTFAVGWAGVVGWGGRSSEAAPFL